MPARPWLHRFDPHAACRLFCFPHAGGGLAMFAGLGRALKGTVDVCPVQLPGRDGRRAEPAATEAVALAAAIVDGLAPALGTPFAVLGHSMGAMVAFEVVRALQARGGPMPFALVVSGRMAPWSARKFAPIAAWPQEDFLDELERRYGGVPAAIRAEPELLAYFLPVLRADYHMVEGYAYQPGMPLGCPIYVYAGQEDDSLDPAGLAAWGEVTTARCMQRLFPGGHFFYDAAGEGLFSALRADLADARVLA